MLITVVCVTWNRVDDLRRALSSIHRQSGVEIETLVVDNGSTDGTQGMIAELFPDVRLLEMGLNAGARAHNAALDVARGDIVFYVDNDMILVEDDLLYRIRGYFQENARLGAAGCHVWEIARNNGSVCLRPARKGPRYVTNSHPSMGYETCAFDGGGAAFRKSALEEVGRFCEEFFMYHLEVDLTTRLLDRGWEVRYFPEVSVIHTESPVQRSKEMISYLTTRNYFWYLYHTHPWKHVFGEAMRYLKSTFWAAVRGDRAFLPWATGVLHGFLSWHQMPHRHPVCSEVIRLQHSIRTADSLRKAQTDETKSTRFLTAEELMRFGLS